MISSKKVVKEPTAGGVNEAKLCPKIAENCKYFCIKCNNSKFIQYFDIFLCFQKKAYLGFMISSKNGVIEPTALAGMIEGKICLKRADNCSYSYLQSNNSKIIQLVNMRFYYTLFASDFYYPEAFCRNFLCLPAWKGNLEEQGFSKCPITQLLFEIWVVW